MGKEIVLKESKYIPHKQAILWDPLNSYQVLKRNTGTENIEGMALHMCELPMPLASSPINGSAFNQMHNLIFLKFFKHLDDMGSKLNLFLEYFRAPLGCSIGMHIHYQPCLPSFLYIVLLKFICATAI
ncbi:unnamed protein product [Arabis nemorensis]|uniref:Uncharacterized protein n=1 Tax=Arabis nemorensis TaxID=586526 RepID=A0A565AQI1_9BRAS|nr:unnamed protein product [Arabis nemorensis]